MAIAILQNGQIQPLEPLPAKWHEGQRLRVESADNDDATLEQIDSDFAQLDRLCADNDPADEVLLSQALHLAQMQSKDQVLSASRTGSETPSFACENESSQVFGN